MKRRILFILCLLFSVSLFGQSPVKWTFSYKKIGSNTFEVHFTAAVQAPWSIYSQATPEGGALPTTVSFNKNPLIELKNKLKEVGTMKKKHEEVFGVDVYYYKGNVDFVQMVKLKSNVKTTLTGKLEYMACNDEQCLPPKEESFSITLQ